MGKPKRKHPNIDETLARPWCYYCERDFDDLKILINHQKAKHYKCERCNRRLNTAGGLSVHMTQVHKETLTSIENALPNRAGLDVEIFGMEGVPEDIIQQHNQRLLQQFAEEEAERRATTGNPAPGSAGATGAKKPKFEGPSELKKRLADYKAKKAADEAAGVGSGNNTPLAIMPEQAQSPGNYPGSASPGYPQQQPQFGAPPANAPYQAQPQPYGQQQQQQHPAFQAQSPPPYTPQQSTFSPPGMPQFSNNQAFGPPQQFQPPGGPGYQQPQFQAGPLPFNGPPQFQGAPSPFQNAPPPQFQQGGPPPQFQNGHQQFQPGPPQQFQNAPSPFQNGPPHQFGHPPPQSPFQQQQLQPPRHNTPPQFNSMAGMPQRPPSLPAAPGLPQRPSVSAPSVNAQQMQQLHQGQMPTPPNSAVQGYPSQTGPPSSSNAPPSLPLQAPSGAPSANLGSTTGTVNGAEPKITSTPEGKASAPQEPVAAQEKKSEDKKGKKEKERSNAKLVYSDNEVSPEEKMAKMSRYAFVPVTA